MNGVAVLTLLTHLAVVSCLDSNLTSRWQHFKQLYNKTYTGDTEQYRRELWEDKIREIETHNLEADQGNHSYWLKETPWDDLTYKEFMYNDTDFDENEHFGQWNNRSCQCDTCTSAKADVPDRVDWTEQGYVTEVRDQGRCGACWAFSVVGAIEGQWYKKTNKLISLSPQSLVDCDSGSNGCAGGHMARALEFVMKNGIASEEDYPYNEQGGECKLSTVGVSARIDCYRRIISEEDLLRAVATVGPISIGISTGPKIQNFGRGVFDECTGPSNHAVVLVGYGVHQGKKVWKIKNSYSKDWGSDGYFYISRECRNSCGIINHANFPTISDDIPGVNSRVKDPDIGLRIYCGASCHSHSLIVFIVASFLHVFLSRVIYRR